MKQIHTHYDNLKVARDAPPEVIRAAYKSLSHKFHPDRHSGSAKATQTFQMIQAAYEVLSEPDLRRKHDAWIARAEVTPPQGSELGAAKRWNGRERRRLWSPANRINMPLSAAKAGRIGMSVTVTALWISVLVLSAMLLLK
jgi:DnaJ-class molecular chaperone